MATYDFCNRVYRAHGKRFGRFSTINTGNFLEVGIDESNYDVITGLERYLAAKLATTSHDSLQADFFENFVLLQISLWMAYSMSMTVMV